MIFFVKFLALLKTALLKSVLFVYKPAFVFMRFFYYKIFVKLYGYYLSFEKKIGLKDLQTNIFSFFFNQKFVHIIVVFVTVVSVFLNLAAKTKADHLSVSNHQTVLANLVRNEFTEFQEDEQLIVETFDKEEFISDIQQSYLDNIGVAKARPGINPKINDDPDMPASAKVKDSEFAREETPKPVQKRTEIISYVVKKGDTISTIAQNFGISVSTILWENDLNAYSVIRPGDKLDILPFNGVKHKISKGENLGYIANKYDVEISEITEANNITANSTLSLGQALMIPNGKKVYAKAPEKKQVTTYDAIKTIVKAPNATPVAGNKMQWPTEGHRITQYYNWRHHGLDIGNKTGTPLYAADAGTVEVAGWGTGYGYQVLIDHGGGKKTRYAHASKLHVKVGDKVVKGETIAAMGSTGWSTGPHLHFEVIINGKKYNPLNYIK